MTKGVLSRVSSDAFWILFGQVANILGYLVLLRLLTVHIAVAVYGEWALCLSLVGIVNQVIFGGVIAAIARYYSIAKETQNLLHYWKGSKVVIKQATAVVCLTAGVCSVGLFFLDELLWIPVALILAAFALITGYSSCLAGIHSSARAHLAVAIHNGANPWLTSFIFLIFIKFSAPSIPTIAAAYTISNSLILLSQLIFFRKLSYRTADNAQDRTTQDWTQIILSFSLPISFFGIFTWVQQASDRWALGYFSSNESVGQYAVLFQLGFTPSVLLIGLLAQLLGPILYSISGNARDSDRNQEVSRLALNAVAASLIVTLLLFSLALMLHQGIFKLLTPPHYWEVSYYLPWMVFAGGVFGAGQLLALKAMSEIKIRRITRIKISTSVTGIILNIIGAYFFGLTGVVVAVSFFTIIYFTWLLLETRLEIESVLP